MEGRMWVGLTKHMLDDIVAVLVLDQLVGVLMELLKYRGSLFWSAMFKDALDHTTAIRVSG